MAWESFQQVRDYLFRSGYEYRAQHRYDGKLEYVAEYVEEPRYTTIPNWLTKGAQITIGGLSSVTVLERNNYVTWVKSGAHSWGVKAFQEENLKHARHRCAVVAACGMHCGLMLDGEMVFNTNREDPEYLKYQEENPDAG